MNLLFRLYLESCKFATPTYCRHHLTYVTIFKGYYRLSLSGFYVLLHLLILMFRSMKIGAQCFMSDLANLKILFPIQNLHAAWSVENLRFSGEMYIIPLFLLVGGG